MNSDDDDLEDALTREYRRASAGQAGRPDAATRAAILAEARAAALRRTPAANDSRVWWRAAASVAVVGVGVLLWRQVDRDVATLTPAPVAVQAEMPDAGRATSAAAAADADVAANAAEQAQAGSRAPVPAPAPERAPARAPAAPAGAAKSQQRAESESAAQGFAAPPPPAPQSDAREAAAEVLETAARSLARSAPRSASAAQLLQTEFPAEYASSTPPHALWVLQDAAGSVLRNGALSGNEEFAAMTPRLEQDYPGQRIGPWRVTPVRNSKGVELQLGVALLQ